MLWRIRDRVADLSWDVMCRTADHATFSGWRAVAYKAASRAYVWARPVKEAPRG